MFYSDSNSNTECASILHYTSLFRKLILTGCRLVTRNVKVIAWTQVLVTAICYCINKTLLVSFFVHRSNSRNRFRIVLNMFSIDFIFYRFFLIYINCRKFNAEFNKLIKALGHRVVFEK